MKLLIKLAVQPKIPSALSVLIYLFLCCCTHQPLVQTQVQALWTELGPNQSTIARAVIDGPTCPSITIGKLSIPMKPRAQTSPTFPILVCETELPPGSDTVSLLGKKFPMRPTTVHKILVIGDTGCRIKNSHGTMIVQACNNVNEWPFAIVAESARKWKPDLVIHVGDYHYREADCPPGNILCDHSPTGDSWASWHADFFAPAQPLLESAPWIFVRGNHELCSRAGLGWFTFFDSSPLTSRCNDQTLPYHISLGDRNFAVVDAADEKNISPSIDSLLATSLEGAWILLHRPFLTPGADDESTGEIELPKKFLSPGKFSLVLAGHVHRLSLNRFSDMRSPELISGNGGTSLKKENPKASRAATLHSSVFEGFGFLTFERKDPTTYPGDWEVVAHDQSGVEKIHCILHEKKGFKSNLDCPSR